VEYPDILARRALPAGRLTRLGATSDFHHRLLAHALVRPFPMMMDERAYKHLVRACPAMARFTSRRKRCLPGKDTFTHIVLITVERFHGAVV
jgi:hypothetical protein